MFFTKTGTAGTCGSLTVYHSPNVSRVTCDPSVFLKEKKKLLLLHTWHRKEPKFRKVKWFAHIQTKGKKSQHLMSRSQFPNSGFLISFCFNPVLKTSGILKSRLWNLVLFGVWLFISFCLSGGWYGIKQGTQGNKGVGKITVKSYLCIGILYHTSILRGMQSMRSKENCSMERKNLNSPG